MKPGDLVRNKKSETGELGLFMGLRTFKAGQFNQNPSYDRMSHDYVCAEVMWFNRSAPNGDRVSTIQTNLLEVVK